MNNPITLFRRHKSILASIVILLFILSANLFFRNKAEIILNASGSSSNADFVGSEKCRSCHSEIFENYIQTAHYNDSHLADEKSIKGSFLKDKNQFVFNPFVTVEMVRQGKKFFQVAKVGGMEMQRAQFDIVVGSGRNGQSYLYWKGDYLFQLPISFFRGTDSWCNSPGFPNIFYYDRPVSLRCLECHSSKAVSKGMVDGQTAYEKGSIVLGIDCERCHGPASTHVLYHQQHPGEKEGRHIINAGKLERNLRVDACAVCHSGLREPIQPPFSFQVGEILEKYSRGKPLSDKPDTLDVHGNQYGLMAASKCYKKSMKMDCSSCHNVHKNEYDQPKLFSMRCLNCHGGTEQVHCSLKPSDKQVLENNCIDCHMPRLPSRNIQLNVSGETKPDLIRSHFISIYRDLTRQESSQSQLGKNKSQAP